VGIKHVRTGAREDVGKPRKRKRGEEEDDQKRHHGRQAEVLNVCATAAAAILKAAVGGNGLTQLMLISHRTKLFSPSGVLGP
jgi:hypothetical protein